MKPRSQLSANEVDALWAGLERRLEGVGLETQPDVAARLMTVVNDPGSSLRDLAAIIKSDPALTGRILRLANSAFFAQRVPITNLERACVLLGIERLKGVSLGFYLAKGTASGGELSRRVWGESVFRACLASEIARQFAPTLAPEAFVVALMMDAGIPILADWEGRAARDILTADEPPTRRFRREFAELPFTHADLAAALARRWKLPDLLAKPIQRHHTQPPDADPADTMEHQSILMLHRLAYYVGAVSLTAAHMPTTAAPLASVGSRVLGLSSEAIAGVTRRACAEYSAVREMFSDVAASLGNLLDLSDGVHRQLVEFMDDQLALQIRSEALAAGHTFLVRDQRVEIQASTPDVITAFLQDTQGRRVMSHVFHLGEERAAHVLAALGVDAPQPAEIAELDAYLVRLAA